MATLTIELSDELARELQHLAEVRHAELAAVAADVLRDALRRRELARVDLDALFDELAARQQADLEPLSDDEAMEIALAEQHAYRAEQRALRSEQGASGTAAAG